MSKWIKCTLAELGEIIGGGTPSTKNEKYYGGDIAWITPKDLSNFQGRYINRGERNITAEGLKNSSARLMPQHSILFTSRAPIGYVAIADNELCTNQGFKSIVPNDNTDYLFLYYLLVHNYKQIENMGSGTTFKEVSGSVMKQIEVFVPSSKAEQSAIAKILGAIDNKIENNTKINHILEQMAKAMFDETFLASNVTEVGSVSLLIEFKNGKTRPNETGIIPVYGGNGILSYTSRNNAENVIIIGRVGAYCGNIYLEPEYCWVSDNAIYAKSKLTHKEYFDYFLLQGLALDTRRIGTTQPLLTQGILNALEVPVPTTKSIELFNEEVTPLFQRIQLNLRENARLGELRDSLLPRLMSGELSVFV